MYDHVRVEGGNFSKRAQKGVYIGARGGYAHAAGMRTPMTLRVNRDELSWVAPGGPVDQ